MKIKKISIILLFTFLGVFLVAFNSHAVQGIETDYPAIQGTSPQGDLIGFIRYIYLFGLAAIGVLALLYLVIGGFMYMLTDTIFKKERAMQFIWGAIYGLILGLTAYLILNTINPDLVSLKEPELQTLICEAGTGPGSNSTQCRWTKFLDTSQNCRDVLGGGWITIDNTFCSGGTTSPYNNNLQYKCCGSSSQ